MEWLRKHVDTVMVLGGILSSVLWMNGKFSEMNEKFDRKFAIIHMRLTRIETVLVMHRMMPAELAHDASKDE